MRIAVSHPYSWPEVRRGAERIIMETAAALSRRGHEVTLVTSGTEELGRRTEDGITIVKLRRRFTDASRHERWFGARIVPLLVTGRYDAVHAMMPSDALAAVVTRPIARHRVLYEELGIPIPDAWREPSPGHPPLKDRPIRHLVARRVDVYGCMSQHALDHYEQHFDGRRGALVPGGVDTERFDASPRTERPTVLFSGVLDEVRKGVSILLDAMPAVAAEFPDVRLWLSGPGSTDELLATAPPEARRLTEVLPLGDPMEQATRYGSAWATVLPSIFESFGMVLLESLACGTPIVVADHSAPPELVRPGAGVVTEPRDPASLAAGICQALRLASDPTTVERCQAVAADYDWNRLAERLEEMYAA